jgi:hypothetical protein
MFYDYPAYAKAAVKMAVELEPDICAAGGAIGTSGPVGELLDFKQQRWPGYNLPDDVGYQFVEEEYMRGDEYPLFLNDPTDYLLRTYLPRVFGSLTPLTQLPSIKNFTGASFSALTPFFARPEFMKMAEALHKAGIQEEKRRKEMMSLTEDMVALGFPQQGQTSGITFAPFDEVSDRFRGMRGSMLDMFRHPDELLALIDKVLEWRISTAQPADPMKRGDPKRAGMPLHRGAEGFMSREQFEKFYWPSLKKAIIANVDLGYIAAPFIEGRFESRLEYLLELPKGKVICKFEHTDMIKAKEVLGNHCCIEGNVPSALLQVGSPSEVEEYCAKLIKVCGKGGGLIMACASSIDEAKPSNIKAMIDSCQKYGVG